MQRQVPRNVISLLHCWFDKVFIKVKWKDCLSNSVKLNAGVRQGGILSPYLFAVYVDNVLIKLKNMRLFEIIF